MNFPARHLALPELATRYAAVRAASLAISEGLDAEDCALQSMPDASPVKWHLAHTTWFFETMVLERFAERHAPFRAEFRDFYNSYYNAVGEQFPRMQRGLISRPALREVLDYRQHTDAAMQALLGQTALPHDALSLIELGLNHEQQHQELMLTDLKHLLSLNPFAPAYRPPVPNAPRRAADLRWRAYDAGVVEVGHPGIGFAFDNESPRHRQFVEPFELASRPVTNADYLAFVEDGGYQRPELWLSEGWQTAQLQRWMSPIYWRKEGDGEGDGWREFTLQGLRPLDPACPVVHVSHYEADAYARWADARLPTEFEWERAAADLPVEGNLAEDGALHPVPSEDGPMQALFGDVWEWTSSSYAPYPGFRTASGAVGEYNGKFMANQYVLRGGSCATPQSHIRATYRNFFPSSARWQFSGIRLARDGG
jgi:ergothioneine biosynthesis protein EgtB